MAWTEEEVLLNKNNMMIAEFIGLEQNDQGYLNDHNSMKYLSGFPSWDYGRLPLEQLRFDYDWNWLMYVVEKIFSIDEYYKFEETLGLFELGMRERFPNLDAVYSLCIEFIEWFNNNKNKQDGKEN